MKTNISVNNTLADMEAKVVKFENLAKKCWEMTDYNGAERFRLLAAGLREGMKILKERAAEPQDDY